MTLNGKYTGEKPKCGRWVIDGETAPVAAFVTPQMILFQSIS